MVRPIAWTTRDRISQGSDGATALRTLPTPASTSPQTNTRLLPNMSPMAPTIRLRDAWIMADTSATHCTRVNGASKSWAIAGRASATMLTSMVSTNRANATAAKARRWRVWVFVTDQKPIKEL